MVTHWAKYNFYVMFIAKCSDFFRDKTRSLVCSDSFRYPMKSYVFTREVYDGFCRCAGCYLSRWEF